MAGQPDRQQFVAHGVVLQDRRDGGLDLTGVAGRVFPRRATSRRGHRRLGGSQPLGQRVVLAGLHAGERTTMRRSTQVMT
ncbi:MAG: hypothetical protein U0Z44_18265 [Kouleothrix sp.]